MLAKRAGRVVRMQAHSQHASPFSRCVLFYNGTIITQQQMAAEDAWEQMAEEEEKRTIFAKVSLTALSVKSDQLVLSLVLESGLRTCYVEHDLCKCRCSFGKALIIVSSGVICIKSGTICMWSTASFRVVLITSSASKEHVGRAWHIPCLAQLCSLYVTQRSLDTSHLVL